MKRSHPARPRRSGRARRRPPRTVSPELITLLARVRFNEHGLVPVITQEEDGSVLMLAWANREALLATAQGGRATYWSRERGELWRKGDTSGHVQHMRAMGLDCDGDAVLYVVRQIGAACHTGTWSCFAGRTQEIPWQTSISSPSSGPRSNRARRTTRRRRATRASSSPRLRRSAARSSRKRTS